MMIAAAKRELQRHQGRSDIRLDELVDIANHLIRLMVPEQPSERVSPILTERTLRFYIAAGLIDRPLGKKGTAALYGYRHLLQALLVKVLQGAFYPVKRIRQVLQQRSDPELEALLAAQTWEKPSEGPEAPRPWDILAREAKARALPSARQRAQNYLRYVAESSQPAISEGRGEDLLLVLREEKALESKTIDQSSAVEVHSQPLCASEQWERFPLADGIELHIRADRLTGLRPAEIRRMVERLLQSLPRK